MQENKSGSSGVFFNLVLLIIATGIFTISFFMKNMEIRYKIILNIAGECLVDILFFKIAVRNLRSKYNKGLGVMFVIAVIILSTIIGFTIHNIL